MDSHQSDLAEEMNRKGWATVCWSTECAVLFPLSLEQGDVTDAD
jgi:UDP-N-acetylglucosamine transferase subunit ALG13